MRKLIGWDGECWDGGRHTEVEHDVEGKDEVDHQVNPDAECALLRGRERDPEWEAERVVQEARDHELHPGREPRRGRVDEEAAVRLRLFFRLAIIVLGPEVWRGCTLDARLHT